MSGISVIICCYNSASHLPETIKHLVRQKVSPNFSIEIIVVDNASTDNTFETAINESKKYDAPHIVFKVVAESRPGLSNARLKGIEEASYDLAVFCDDDNWLDENYLAIAKSFMDENGNVGIVGGRSEPVIDIPVPFWFATFQDHYAVGVQSLFSGDLTVKRLVWGAGMVFRKNVFNNLLSSGFSNLLADRTGTSLSSGGDSEICRWFVIAGYKLWYDERLIFKHHISANRITREYLKNLRERFVIDDIYVRYYNRYLDSVDNPEPVFYKIPRVVWNFIKWKIARHPENRLYLAAVLPLSISKNIDPEFYMIRKAAKTYKTMYQTQK